jgi:hypothetical protein
MNKSKKRSKKRDTKMMASIAREKGRDTNKHEIIDTVRISLPIRVMHSPATETDDSFFSGVELISTSNGTSYIIFHLGDWGDEGRLLSNENPATATLLTCK